MLGRLPLALIILASLLLTGCQSSDPTASASRTTAPLGPPATNRTDRVSPPAQGPLPPKQGAAFGAWVLPTKYTGDGTARQLALDTFQRQIGRSLSIVQDFHPWQESFPTDFDRQVADSPATLLLSWAGTDTRQIASGRHDTLIRQRAQAIKELGSPILFRWRWEMDRPNLASVVHSPADYIAAWKHVRSIFQEVGATNAGWVWCPLSTGFDEGRAGAYYPGDDQVEWICTDAYSPDPSVPFASVAASFLSWAADHDKPIIFAEIGAQHTGGTARAEWLRGVAETTERYPQIKAVVYFEANVDRDGYQRSWSLRTSATDLAALRSIADRPVLAGKLSAGNG